MLRPNNLQLKTIHRRRPTVNSSQRILVTGGSGYLGAALLRYLGASRPAYEIHATCFSNRLPLASPYAHPLDLCDEASVAQVVRTVQPQLIIHTAAQMVGDLERLRRVNAQGTEWLARHANEIGARLIHLSTDVIFDGQKGNYNEQDTPHPITPYGTSKAEAESLIEATGVQAAIVRTSLIYGLAPVDPRTRAVLDGAMPRLFTDELRCPIEVNNLCAALVELSESGYTGILHLAGPQALSRYEFGVKLVRALGGDERQLIPLRSDESSLIRPKDCTLDCTRASQLLQTKLLGVDELVRWSNSRMVK